VRSIQQQLGWGLVLGLLLTGLLLNQTSLWLFESNARDNISLQLEAEAENLLLAIGKGPDDLQLDTRHINPRFQRPFSGYYFHIRIEGSRTWRSRSLWDSSPDWPSARGLNEALIDGPSLLVYHRQYQRGGQIIHIDVAQDYSPIQQTFSRIRWINLGLIGLTLLVLLLLLRQLVRRALRPLEQARLQISQLQRGTRTELDLQAPDELQPLVAQINRLLQDTETTLQRSRHAIGNLGHALKTPLAVLRSLSSRTDPAGTDELLTVLNSQLNLIEERISLELNRARMAADVLQGQRFDCQAEIPALIQTLGMIHGDRLLIDWQAPDDCQLPWDREDMLELLGNLLDNACKWARSRVRLAIAPDAGQYRLLIEDDGPGIAPVDRQRVMRRGVRLDEQITGHGFGLGIVNDIVDAWQGHWDMHGSSLGGLAVEIHLPLHRRPASPRSAG